MSHSAWIPHTPSRIHDLIFPLKFLAILIQAEVYAAPTDIKPKAPVCNTLNSYIQGA